MPVPFDDAQADFSGMSPMGAEMYIAFVKHKTFVRVDEEGTEPRPSSTPASASYRCLPACG